MLGGVRSFQGLIRFYDVFIMSIRGNIGDILGDSFRRIC